LIAQVPHEAGKDSGILYLALPDSENTPTSALQLRPHTLIARLVPSQLWRPVIGIGFDFAAARAAMRASMPKAAVNEYDGVT
jgi:hypothetical protein